MEKRITKSGLPWFGNFLKKQTHAVSFLTLLPLIAGCGDKFQRLELGFTEVQFNNRNLQAMDLTQAWLERGATAEEGDAFTEGFSGHGMIYAVSQDNPALRGRKYLPTMAGGNALNWIIPNGSWKFYVAGYDSTNMSRSGSSGGCGSSGLVALNGGSQTVPVVTTGGLCNSTPFVASSVNALSFHFCSAATDFSTATNLTVSCSSMTGGGASTVIYGAQVAIYELDELTGPNPYIPIGGYKIISGCVSFSAGDMPLMSASSGIFPPLGHAASLPGAAFRTEILTYNTTGCTAGSLHKTYVFRDGISAAGGPAGSGTMRSINGGDTILDESDKSIWNLDSGAGHLFIKD